MHNLPCGMAKQVECVLDAPRTFERSGVDGNPSTSGGARTGIGKLVPKALECPDTIRALPPLMCWCRSPSASGKHLYIWSWAAPMVY